MSLEHWRKQFTLPKILFYLLFHGAHLGIFIVGWYVQAANDRLAGLNKLNWSVWISRGAALNLAVDVTIILLPMCRNLMTWLRPKMRSLPLDETQYFHRQCAYSILLWTIVHTTSHYVNFFNVERFQIRPEAAIQINYTQAGGITGHVMIVCMLIMYTTAHAKIRSQSYETFWYSHHLFIPFLLAMYTHATGCFVRDSPAPESPFAGSPFWNHCLGYEGWRWELVGGFIYLCERVYREIRSRQKTEVVKVIRHPYDALELQFTKPSFAYRPGQWLFLNCPSVSRTQWHPFTITSCPFDPYISVHIRQVGDWTKDLSSAFGAGPEHASLYNSLDPLGIYEIDLGEAGAPTIRVDGPYGAPAEDVFENDVAVLVGTGIGVTPWASILKNIYNMRASPNPPRRLRRVEFIWVCKDTSSFEWFQALLSSLEAQALQDTASGRPEEFLKIHTYLTAKVDADTAQNIVLNSVGTDKDPLTELSTRTNFGRPDFQKLFLGMREGILDGRYLGERVDGVGEGKRGKIMERGHGKTNVGVYFCGPNHAARDMRRACREADGGQVRFRFWKEHF
ncbi:MAG: hypothetical protein Q9162_004640 [Coniocarpon cinnabarinum]